MRCTAIIRRHFAQLNSEMITPFVLRRSLATPFFNSTRSQHVGSSILTHLLRNNPVRSTSLQLRLPLIRQASTLRLEAPSILKFVPNNVWKQRVPQYGRARDPFRRGPPPPQGFWDRIKRFINTINPNYVLWGILGLNGCVFATWYVAIANAVRTHLHRIH